jgi:hypothetical protein
MTEQDRRNAFDDYIQSELDITSLGDTDLPVNHETLETPTYNAEQPSLAALVTLTKSSSATETDDLRKHFHETKALQLSLFERLKTFFLRLFGRS